jgi:hypothetical protein
LDFPFWHKNFDEIIFLKTTIQLITHAINYLAEHGISGKLAVIYNGGTRQVAIILDCTPKEAGL